MIIFYKPINYSRFPGDLIGYDLKLETSGTHYVDLWSRQIVNNRFNPKFNGEDDNQAKHEFFFEVELSEDTRDALLSWCIEELPAEVKMGDSAAKSKSYALNMLEASALEGEKITHSIYKRNGEIIGIAQYRSDTNRAKVSLIASDPLRLVPLAQGKVTGFGKKLVHFGLENILQEVPSIRLIDSDATSIQSEIILGKLGFDRIKKTVKFSGSILSKF